MKYSIVIPCFNEEKGLGALFDAILKFPKKYDAEFILVENGSVDRSRDVFNERIDLDEVGVKKVYIDENKGYGFGILQGLKQATGDYVGWMHADLQLPITELIKFFEYGNLYKGKDPLFMKGIRNGRPFLDSFFTFNMGIFETLLFRSYMYDVMAMPIIFDKRMLLLFDNPPFDFSLDIYVYALAKINKFKIYREKIVLKEREFGSSSWNKGLSSRIKQSKKMIDGSVKIRRIIK